MRKKNNFDYRKEVLPVRTLFAMKFPRCFTLKGRGFKLPLKVGIMADLVKAFPELDPKLIGAALADYCSGPVYTKAITPGTKRVDLNGIHVGIVTEEDSKFQHHKEYQRIQRWEARNGRKSNEIQI